MQESTPSTSPSKGYHRWRLVLGFIVLVLVAPYFIIPHYQWPDGSPFLGSHWYNPYEKLNDSSAWKKCNFHAHSKAWSGVTAGQNSDSVMDSVYAAMHYDVLGPSNYFSMRSAKTVVRDDSSVLRILPCYEHGYSIQKSHRIVVGADEVDWLDIITPQTVHIKQFIFQRLHARSELCIMAHPAFGRPSYTTDDAATLCDYDCMEVLNHYRRSTAHWDSALTHGRCVWIAADDDTHDVLNGSETGVRWTMVQSENTELRAICSAMKQGRAYGVEGRNGTTALGLQDLKLSSDTATVRFAGRPRFIRAISDGGRTVAEVKDNSSLSLGLNSDMHYLRFECADDSSHLFLNPIIRTESGLEHKKARINIVATTLYFLAFSALTAMLLFASRRRN